MAADESDENRGFTIIDRRGEGRGEAPSEALAERALPAADFATFALSLGSSALYHLGLIPDPETGKPAAKRDFGLVRQSIETLEMLQTKTRGNLDEDESHLLQSLLYELRMRFVEAKQGGSPEQAPESEGT